MMRRDKKKSLGDALSTDYPQHRLGVAHDSTNRAKAQDANAAAPRPDTNLAKANSFPQVFSFRNRTNKRSTLTLFVTDHFLQVLLTPVLSSTM